MTTLGALWPKFRAVAADGEAAWQPLVEAIHPALVKLAGYQPLGRLKQDADAAHEIATRVIERLHARSFAAIHKLCAAEPTPVLEAWLRVLVRNAAIDVVRAAPEFERKTEGADARWISLATLTTMVGAQPDSLVEKRRSVIAFVAAAVARAEGLQDFGALATEWNVARLHVRRLAQRGAHYRAVIERVLAGSSYPEVAAELAITRREVELTVQYIEELLAARRFAVG